MFTDMASEMLYPVMPMYLTGVLGASMLELGLLEGAAEAVASFLKAFFGRLSDTLGKRAPFVVGGYTLSALSKPIPGLFPFFSAVAAARIADRLGKAVRTAARDALLAGYAPKDRQGTVFGFHRAMDTLGAAIGPALALLYLAWHPGDYVPLFFIAFAPSLGASALTFLVRDIGVEKKSANGDIPLRFREVLRSSRSLKLIFAAVFVFALANSSDVFLIMRARQLGFSETASIGAYILYNLLYAALSYPLGRLADRIGKKHTFEFGLIVFALTYLCFAVADSAHALVVAGFVLYAVYAAASESIIKAWISDLTPAALKGTAFGMLTMLMSVGAIAASTAGGYLWDAVSPSAPFLVGAAGALFALLFAVRV